jgi:ADP-heptose:LPS heptosyltransferase
VFKPPLQDSPPRRILVTRDDKLGDVILATPVLESLRKKFPDAYIAVLVRPATYQAVRENPFIDRVIIDDKPGWSGIRSLAEKIAEKNFDVALILFVSARASLATFMAKIPARIGPSSRWGMIFLTRRIRQKRSQCRKHEADYNLDLAAAIGAEPVRNTSVFIDKATQNKVDNLFSELEVDKDIPMIGIHPGGGGTSRGWKVERYAELIEQLTRPGRVQFFITHGPGEEKTVHRLVERYPDNIFFHPRDYGILEMAEIIRRCKVFVSASTGPMHLASAVKTPVVALFCPVHVCGERRWGPYSVPYKLFKPDAPVCDHCVEEECTYFDCMDCIRADKVACAVKEFLTPEGHP